MTGDSGLQEAFAEDGREAGMSASPEVEPAGDEDALMQSVIAGAGETEPTEVDDEGETPETDNDATRMTMPGRPIC